MKISKQLLNILTAFLSVIGVCCMTLVVFIMVYPQLNIAANTYDQSHNEVAAISEIITPEPMIVENSSPIVSPAVYHDENRIFPNTSTSEPITEINSDSMPIATYATEDIDTDLISQDIIQESNSEEMVIPYEPAMDETLSSEITTPQYDVIVEYPVTNTTSGTGTGDASRFNLYDNPEQQNTTAQYVLNTSTLKIHSPHCRDVPKIKAENYLPSNEDVNVLFSMGYTYCGHCHGQ